MLNDVTFVSTLASNNARLRPSASNPLGIRLVSDCEGFHLQVSLEAFERNPQAALQALSRVLERLPKSIVANQMRQLDNVIGVETRRRIQCGPMPFLVYSNIFDPDGRARPTQITAFSTIGIDQNTLALLSGDAELPRNWVTSSCFAPSPSTATTQTRVPSFAPPMPPALAAHLSTLSPSEAAFFRASWTTVHMLPILVKCSAQCSSVSAAECARVMQEAERLGPVLQSHFSTTLGVQERANQEAALSRMMDQFLDSPSIPEGSRIMLLLERTAVAENERSLPLEEILRRHPHLSGDLNELAEVLSGNPNVCSVEGIALPALQRRFSQLGRLNLLSEANRNSIQPILVESEVSEPNPNPSTLPASPSLPNPCSCP